MAQARDFRAVEPLIACLEDYDVASSAADALIDLGKPAIEPLTARYKDPIWNGYVLEVLRALGDPRAAEPLLKRMTSKDWSTNSSERRALLSLGKLLAESGDPSVIEPLIAKLQDEDRSVRHGVAGMLGELGDKRAVVPLIACLMDQDIWVQN
jgi:HEAT repeat protein